MCGLVGTCGFLDRRDLDAFKDLLWIDAVRGQDNTGAASVLYDKSDEYNLCKVTGAVNELFDKKSFDKVVQPNVSFLMGHNRSKTLGTVAAKNAHPFVFDNVIGAHNGTLTWASKGRMKDDLKFETDSEALFNDINEFGVEETIKKMDGAWALTWYDRKQKQINFLRNKERPLFYVLDDSNSTLYWASEHTMLYMVLNRHQIPFTGKVKEVPENTWVRWQLNDKSNVVLDKPVHRHLAATPWTSSLHIHNSNQHNHTPIAHWRNRERLQQQQEVKKIFHQQNGNHSLIEPGIISIIPFRDQKPDLMKDINVKLAELRHKGKLDLDLYHRPSRNSKGFYKLYDGNYAFQAKFEKMMEEGCVICGDHPVWTEPVKFLKDNTFICTCCMFDPDHKARISQLVGDFT